MLVAQITEQLVGGLFSVWGMLIVAIISSTTITVAKMSMHHRERVAMIERGMRPDDLQETE